LARCAEKSEAWLAAIPAVTGAAALGDEAINWPPNPIKAAAANAALIRR
jgi:hypothetical protein